jgi:hypothetical protein
MSHRTVATIAGRVRAQGPQQTLSLVNLRRLATAALAAANVAGAAAFHDHYDASSDQRNSGLAVVLCGVDQGFDRGRRQ